MEIKTDLENYKCVLVIDSTMPTGVIANTAAVLSMTIGKNCPELIGHDIKDRSGVTHKGITCLPIPILASDKKDIPKIISKVKSYGEGDVLLVDFTTLAKSCASYDEYEEKLTANGLVRPLEYIGIAIIGQKSIINKCTGNLKLIR